MPIILNGTTGITTPGITNTGAFVFQGVVELPAGTAAAPALTTTGDTNTGIYFPAADQVAISTGGTQKLFVGSGLVVNEDGLDFDTRIEGDTDANLFFVDASADKVGIGTSSPGAKFTVLGPIGSLNDSAGTVRFATDDADSGIAGNRGAGIVFAQRYFTGDATLIRVGGIYGVKTEASGNFGGGLAFYSQGASSADMSERMRLDSSGNVGIGTTSPGNFSGVTFGDSILDVNGVIQCRGDATNGLALFQLGGNTYRKAAIFTPVGTDTPYLAFAVADSGSGSGTTERARITNGGQFCIGTTGSAGDARLRVVNEDNTSGDFLIVGQMGGNAINTSSYQYIGGNYAGSDNVYIYGNGNIVNTNNSYGTLSDVKLKQDIIDATSQWDDVKAFKFRKFRFKEEVSRNPDAPHQLGLIAQELEQTSPGLVDTTPDRQNEGETMKTIKTSVLLMKATKALQEAMARIEMLESDVAALKGAN